MTDDTKDSKSASDAEIGYCKPPKHSQFKPGKSGNPKGRPKGAKNLRKIVEEEAYAKITVKEGGKTRKTTKVRALTKAMLNKGIQGDTRAANIFLSLAREYLSQEDLQALVQAPLSDEARQILYNHADLLAALDGPTDE